MHVPKLEPYLSFDGDCAEAFKFYEQVLGAEIDGITTFGARMKEGCPPSDVNHRDLRLRVAKRRVA